MSFKARLQANSFTLGSWVKTPHPHVVEVLSYSALDCLVLDAEHAPFDRTSLDACLGVADHDRMPVLVRPASSAPEHILNALDCGAAGVVLPHICSAAEAQAAVRHCHYVPGGRGFAGSSRAAGYTTKGMAKHREDAAYVAVILQIEDVDAVDAIDEIVAVDGVDALFIGRADLTIAYGAATPDDDRVVAAVERICAAGVAAGRTIGMFLPRIADIGLWRAKGVSLFILSSDQDFLLRGAAQLVTDAA